ncbi:MAG: glutamine synthetase family protein [Candidatus Bathyarchaeota archaeon]|nr:glutamine synthetase family protein [Candidatus Bathyarchaeota archaeon]MDH5788540.1 glutamine synthetase family protein [Candidatus Bathyarchaeota archaeon]
MQGIKFSDKEEIVSFVSENGIRILNLCHIPEDGRLRTLSFSASDKNRVYEILDLGERVDGSNLFSFITPGKSDIYIMPKCDKGLVNPFSTVPALNLLCRYLDENGKPLDVAPENVLTKAEEKLRSSKDVILKALAELEFYIISKQQSEMLFPGAPEKNYHDSSPFTKFEWLRNEILVALTSSGIGTKYGHSEVGRLLCNGNTLMEQHEVEFAPQNLAEMAETITIAKWIIRNVCARHGISVSFCPKIALEHAGTGMHIHLCGLKNGENVVANHDGTLTVEAREMIGGMLRFAPSLAAFGNPTPPSYLRFIARKESPMHICWSARNRLALIRIPLWWSFKRKGTEERDVCRETFEYRAPDAFASAYLLFAGIAVAINYGLKNSKESLEIAEKLHVEETAGRRKRFKLLPRSCSESARNLRKDRKFYEADDVFPKKVIDKTIEKLSAYKDEDLWKNLAEKPEKVESMLRRYLHYG